MKTNALRKRLTQALSVTAMTAALCGCATEPKPAAMTPKHALVVSTTAGFRHSSIPTAEKIIASLGQSSGTFTVDFARVEPADPQYAGADGKPDKAKVNAAIKAVLAEKMSAEALKKYDAVIFANTTGDLPLPDPDAFLEWIKSGKAFIGMHSATDTFPNYRPFIEMIGAHFRTHKEQVEVDIRVEDASCPSCKHLGGSWTVFDEIYIMKDFDRTKVHGLLRLDQHPNDRTPGDYPVAWRKEYGQGRVFYTSLGHREDIWDAEWKDKNGARKNSPEVSRQYQQHILGGIRWALGLEK
jgi:type 1 glutamine amidotransferase